LDNPDSVVIVAPPPRSSLSLVADRGDPAQQAEAETLLQSSRSALGNALNRVPEVVQLYALQAQTLQALSQLAAGPPADLYRQQAKEMIAEAVRRSPLNRDYQEQARDIDRATQ
ncbi:MAG: hypothetical protein ACKOUR_03055, partial [Planctomycetota bacterium]